MRSRRVGSFARRILIPALTGLVVAASRIAAGPSQETMPITVAVTVLDNTNAPVRDLIAADFTIQEDGAPRIVTSARPADEPLSIALLLDTARPPMGTIPPTLELRAGVAAFVGIVQADHPQSRIALMETGGAAVMTLDFTNRTDDLTRAIGRLLQTQRSSVVVLEALTDIGAALAEQQNRRRAIVVLDFDTQDTSQEELTRLSITVQKAGASVWAISIRRDDGSPNRVRESVLDFLTRITGGLRLTALTATSLESQFRMLARAMTSQYFVTYQRPIGIVSAAEVRATATRGTKVLTTRILQ